MPKGESAQSWARLEAGFTEKGVQVRCVRHDLNIIHIDFEGHNHPADTGRRGDFGPGAEDKVSSLLLSITMQLLRLHEISNDLWIGFRDGRNRLTSREVAAQDPWRKLLRDASLIFPPDELVPQGTKRPSLAEIIRRTFKDHLPADDDPAD
jgi:hypothetical protein